VPLRQIAEAIGRHLGLRPRASPRERGDHFGWFARFAALDNPTSSTRTRQLLDWKPEHSGLLADIDQGHYFN